MDVCVERDLVLVRVGIAGAGYQRVGHDLVVVRCDDGEAVLARRFQFGLPSVIGGGGILVVEVGPDGDGLVMSEFDLFVGLLVDRGTCLLPFHAVVRNEVSGAGGPPRGDSAAGPGLGGAIDVAVGRIGCDHGPDAVVGVLDPFLRHAPRGGPGAFVVEAGHAQIGNHLLEGHARVLLHLRGLVGPLEDPIALVVQQQGHDHDHGEDGHGHEDLHEAVSPLPVKGAQSA